jgi:hypothetical protein
MPGSLASTIGSTFLAGTISGTSAQQSPHIALRLTGREVILALLSIAVVIVLLAAPVVGEAISGSVSEAAAKVAPTTFLVGLGILVIGLVFGAEILDIAGGSLVGLVILGWIIDNYLGASCRGEPLYLRCAARPGSASVRR